MKKGLTELVFILDKSGSMSGLETDTIGSYNSMLQKQKAVEGECHITTVLFDNNYELLYDRIDIRAVNPITENGQIKNHSQDIKMSLSCHVETVVLMSRAES